MLRTHFAHDVSLSTVNKLIWLQCTVLCACYLYIPFPVQRLCVPYCIWMPDPAIQCTGLLRCQLCSPFYMWLDHALHLFHWFLFDSIFFNKNEGNVFSVFPDSFKLLFGTEKILLNENIWRKHPKYLKHSPVTSNTNIFFVVILMGFSFSLFQVYFIVIMEQVSNK